MSKTLNITINAKKYDIDVDDDFSAFLESQIREDFDSFGNNELKILLSAYVKKCHILYKREKQIATLIENIERKI